MSILHSAKFEAQSFIKSQAIGRVELSEAGLGLGLGLELQIRNPAYINIVWGFEMTPGSKPVQATIYKKQ